MPIQVSYGPISRADVIRESAIALLESELSNAFENPTPSPIARVQPETQQATSFVEHVFTFVLFVALSYVLFAVVSR
jgi:hypothetical protein